MTQSTLQSTSELASELILESCFTTMARLAAALSRSARSSKLSAMLATLITTLPCAVAAAPTNIIYIIGDGMGPAYTSAYRYFNDDPSTKVVEPTIFDKLLVGMASTYPDDDTYVTDSAAAATALATSHKSYNGAIAVNSDKQVLPTLLEYAKAKQRTTAVVVTSQINHATPASFLAHNEHRRNYNEIADDFLSNLIDNKPVADLMLGGGQQYFVREDRNLVAELRALGYQYQDDFSALSQLDRLPALGLFAPKGLAPALGSPAPLRLSQMTEHALTLLPPNPKGFVMMIEASQIDWCGHSNDIACAMAEMTDLAATTQMVVDYIDQHPNTLLVMTADHSTGGLSLGANGIYQWRGQLLHSVKQMPSTLAKWLFESPAHLASEQAFNDFWQTHLGLPIDAEQRNGYRLQLQTALAQDKGVKEATTLLKQQIDTLTSTGWTTGGHDAVDVQVFAYGQGAAQFNGHQDNTQIAKKLIDLIH